MGKKKKKLGGGGAEAEGNDRLLASENSSPRKEKREEGRKIKFARVLIYYHGRASVGTPLLPLFSFVTRAINFFLNFLVVVGHTHLWRKKSLSGSVGRSKEEGVGKGERRRRQFHFFALATQEEAIDTNLEKELKYERAEL